MKKNKLFRLLTLALTLVFLCQFAVTAFAGTSGTWSDGYYTYYLETTVSGTFTRSNVPITSTTVNHSRGSTTYLDGYYDLSYTDPSWDTCGYKDEALEAAGSNANKLTQNNKYMWQADTNVCIPSSAASDEYCIRTDVYEHRVGFEVFQVDAYGTYYYDGGQVYAPYGFSDFVTGYAAK